MGPQVPGEFQLLIQDQGVPAYLFQQWSHCDVIVHLCLVHWERYHPGICHCFSYIQYINMWFALMDPQVMYNQPKINVPVVTSESAVKQPRALGPNPLHFATLWQPGRDEKLSSWWQERKACSWAKMYRVQDWAMGETFDSYGLLDEARSSGKFPARWTWLVVWTLKLRHHDNHLKLPKALDFLKIAKFPNPQCHDKNGVKHDDIH